MLRHFTAELEELNTKLLEMAGLVESAISRSVRSLVDQNKELAEQVIRDEPTINRMEMEIDGMATRLLALRQPVARDLRFLTSALKINTDLERMGDLAQHIAERSFPSCIIRWSSPWWTFPAWLPWSNPCSSSAWTHL